MERIKLSELLKENPGSTYGKSTYIDIYEDVKGFVDMKFIGESHFASDYMVVFEKDGKLYGFETWQNSEGENGLSEDYSMNPDIPMEVQPVKEVKVVSYEYES